MHDVSLKVPKSTLRVGGAVSDTTKTKFKKRAAAMAVASCLSFVPWLAEAAGLGKITVFSGLGQPLRAEIELNASRAELAGMSARLAPQSAFREAGIDYASSLYDLRFSIEKRSNGMPVLKVTSVRPVNDPFMDFLVELNWPAGPAVREYTFLLDPPELQARAAGRPVSTAEARVVESVAASAPAPKAETPRQAVVVQRVVEAKRSGEPGTHVVQQGETLRKIAGETKYDGVSLEQMLLGLFKANPDAFIGDDINRLKAGAILNVPEKAVVAAVPEAEAKKVYVTQAGDWNAYRQKLAAATAKGQARQEDPAQSASGKIAARVEEQAAPVGEAKDQVKVSSAEAAAKGAAGGRSAAAVEEDLIVKDKSLKEAQDRLAVLEKNVVELQKLVDMKTQHLAELQQQASGRQEEAAKAALPAQSAAPTEPAKPAEVAPVVEAPKPAEAPKSAEEIKLAEPPKAAEVKPQAPPKATVQAPAPESDFDPVPLIGGGGVLALLAGYFLLRRRRSAEEPALTTAIPGPSSLGPNSVFRMTGGQSVDTGNVPLQTGDFSQTGPGTIDTDEVDPVAEADVYMAYGRDTQAEEILIEALRKDPHRTAIHAKLLEIYANRKSIKQFDTLASELYAQTGGLGVEWEKVAAMGATLDPENPLYSGGRSAAPVAETAGAPATAMADAMRATTVVLPGALGAMAAAATSDGPAVPQLPAEEVAEPVVAGVEEIDFAQTDTRGEVGALDFDLGGPAQSLAQTEVQSLEVIEPLPEIEAIDFDLGMPSSFAATEVNPHLPAGDTLVMGGNPAENDFSATYVSPEPSTGGRDELAQGEAGMLDFQLDTGAPGEETVVNSGALAAGGEFASDPMANTQILQEATLGNDPMAQTVINPALAQAAAERTVVAGMSRAGDLDAAEFDVNLSESVFIGRPMSPPDFDMTSINLDLGADVPESTQVADFSGNFSAEGARGGQGSEEVSTKLALAKAYEDMGDYAQARELLQEVVNEGSGDLVAQAREIMGRLRA